MNIRWQILLMFRKKNFLFDFELSFIISVFFNHNTLTMTQFMTETAEPWVITVSKILLSRNFNATRTVSSFHLITNENI